VTIDDPDRASLIVVSGRCDDTASTLVVDPDWLGEAHAQDRITPELVNAVRNAGRKSFPTGSTDASSRLSGASGNTPGAIRFGQAKNAETKILA